MKSTTLEAHVMRRIEALTDERDTLLAALRELVRAWDAGVGLPKGAPPRMEAALNAADAAIAKAEGR